jgi:hypothetical protein
MIRSLPLRITLIKPPPGVPFCEVVPINNSISRLRRHLRVCAVAHRQPLARLIVWWRLIFL